MATTTHHPEVWRLARRQHWVVTYEQLLGLGLTRAAVRHRVAVGRLHRVARGVYAVGRPDLTTDGRRMAAVLSCGPQAALSHQSAAALYGIAADDPRHVHVSIPSSLTRRRPGLVVHRRAVLSAVTHRGIRVTTPATTLADLARVLARPRLEAAVIEADKRDLIGAATAEAILGAGYARTDSPLERRFLALALAAGLPAPLTQARVGRHRVDFLWPQLGLVAETDGLRYHRTPAQQARDRRRDQELTVAGLTVLRFTYAQVLGGEAGSTLAAVAARLSRSACAP